MYSPPDSPYSLWFYPSINRFTDEDGNVIHDLHELFNTCELDMWKRTQDYGLLVSKQGDFVELYYLEPEDKENYERYLNALYKDD